MSVLFGQLAPERRPELVHITLAHDLEQHVLLLVLLLPHRALLRLFQVAHLFNILEVLDILHQLFVLLRARCQLVGVDLLLLREELVRVI